MVPKVLPEIKTLKANWREVLGEANVTIPNWKTKDLRRAYYASVSHVDDEIGR